MLELIIADLTAYTGISTAWATVIVNAVNAGSTVIALASIFASAGLSAGLILVVKEFVKKNGTKAAIAW
ncbi:circular bacteriocin, circularin A/uberolysin family [Paenibacillus woosongensis]|uniref:Circular bacteriocin, circularin A/uberolysin family n=1 Tax=Paenibacillus woosongensis TaxID=307580 RepID=A0AA95I1W9_9BACL|nr:circular bacteriocin, circularin A/uberolysin family [Paenibacillus woosongensis]WHX49049.1 circular bacteriocin, circularin A/uberolysin family [Paenibacillus woosongensis]